MRKVIIRHIPAAIVFVCLLGVGTAWSASPPKKGGVFPEINLPVPTDPAQKGYLGLSQDTPFKIPQIKAEVIIIEIFNMY